MQEIKFSVAAESGPESVCCDIRGSLATRSCLENISFSFHTEKAPSVKNTVLF